MLREDKSKLAHSSTCVGGTGNKRLHSTKILTQDPKIITTLLNFENKASQVQQIIKDTTGAKPSISSVYKIKHQVKQNAIIENTNRVPAILQAIVNTHLQTEATLLVKDDGKSVI